MVDMVVNHVSSQHSWFQDLLNDREPECPSFNLFLFPERADRKVRRGHDGSKRADRKLGHNYIDHNYIGLQSETIQAITI